MRNLKILAAGCVLGALAYLAAPRPVAAQTPYLHALSDLRTARDYIQSDHRPHFEHDRNVAVQQINNAIDQVKHAAWDDGKQTKYAPPTHPDTDPWHPLREAVRWLDEAKKRLLEGVDRPENAGLRERAVSYVDQARQTVLDLIQREGH